MVLNLGNGVVETRLEMAEIINVKFIVCLHSLKQNSKC
jgi:hypothetical protein